MKSRVLWNPKRIRFDSHGKPMQLFVIVMALVLSPFSLPANAAPFVYVVTLTQQLGTIDLANGKFQPIGNGTPDSLSNLVWWRGSLRTLTTFPTLGSLAKINRATGEETVIGATGLSFNAFDLAEVRGKLYLTDFSNNLYLVDPGSGVATPIANTGMPPDPNIPLTFNGEDGSFNLCDEGLYGIGGKIYATFDSFAIDPTQTPPTIVHRYVSPRVYEVDPFTGATRILAETDWQLSAIVEADGKVYAFKAVFDGFDWNISVPIGHAELVTLDLKTGRTKKIADIDPSLGPIFGAAPVR